MRHRLFPINPAGFLLTHQPAVRGEHRVEVEGPKERVITHVETDESAQLDDLGTNLLNLRPGQSALGDATKLPVDAQPMLDAIPTVTDRVLQRAVLRVLDDRFERVFLDCSYGYRIGRSVADAVRKIVLLRENGFCWLLDGDIAETSNI